MRPRHPPGRIETIDGADLYGEVHGNGEPLDWAAAIAEWSGEFQMIVPDLRGHGRSGILSKPFRHRDAAGDMLALLDRLNAGACRGIGVSGGDTPGGDPQIQALLASTTGLCRQL